MARFYGAIGYVDEEETSLDVHTPTVTERMYKGELQKSYRKLDNGIGVNDDVSLNNSVSILSDPYMQGNMNAIRYAKWRGICWKVTTVDASQYPRLILTLGGVYNGPTA